MSLNIGLILHGVYFRECCLLATFFCSNVISFRPYNYFSQLKLSTYPHVRMCVCVHIVYLTLVNNFYIVCRLTFRRVVRKKSTEEFSCVPYIIALSNCLLYTWYGLPVVSNKWENFPLVTINGLGIFFEFSFIIIYIWFASAKRKASNFVLNYFNLVIHHIQVFSTYIDLNFHMHACKKNM